MNKFKDFYQIIKPQIEKELIKFNNNILKEKNELILENLKVFANLNDKGKMIRGTLIALGYSFKNTDISKSIYLACAYEVFETSILVHDDIIDNDNLRRGVATLSYYNKDKYKDFLDNKEYGDAIALCIGDYGLFESIGIIVDNYSDNNNLGLLPKFVTCYLKIAFKSA
jgi:geranylgeranyl diphosphate synthase type I